MKKVHSHIMNDEDNSQIEVCYVCGDRGFTNALINCSNCCETDVHQYCIGITPGSIDDTFDWICEDCNPRMESEPCTSSKYDGAFTKLKRKAKCSNSEDEKTNYSSANMETCDDSVGETWDDHDYLYSGILGEIAVISDEDQPKPLHTLPPTGLGESSDQNEYTKYGSYFIGRLEELEGTVSSPMENPDELKKGIVLLVNPSGETFIQENFEELMGPYGENFTLDGSEY